MKTFAFLTSLFYFSLINAAPMDNLKDPNFDSLSDVSNSSPIPSIIPSVSSIQAEPKQCCLVATQNQLNYLNKISSICIISQDKMAQEACALCQSELNDQYRYNTETEQFQCSICSPEVSETIRKMMTPGNNCPVCFADTTNNFALLPCGHGKFNCM